MTREKRIYIRVSDHEWNQVKQEADKRGISMSDLLRSLIAQLPSPSTQPEQ